MNLDNYIKYLTKLRDKKNAGNFQVVKWETFYEKDLYKSMTTSLTKNDIRIDEKLGLIEINFSSTLKLLVKSKING
jgi:hypothetical protein